MKRIPVTLCLIALTYLLALTGCGDDTVGPGTPIPAELVGSWTFTMITVNAQQVPLDVALEWQPATVAALMTLGSDNSYLYEEKDAAGATIWNETGFVVVSGQAFTLTVDKINGAPVPPDIMAGTWQVIGGEFTTVFQNGQDTIVSLLTSN